MDPPEAADAEAPHPGADADPELARLPLPPAAEREDRVTEARVRRYLATTAEALAKVEIAPPDPSHLRDAADDVLEMARAYHDDAKHFARDGEIVLAYGAVNYAHGWLDAGVRLGLLDGGGDDVLFTLRR